MSYILDALKKIEHEKTKAGARGAATLTHELYHGQKQATAPAFTGGRMVLLLVAVALVACGGTWFALKKPQKSPLQKQVNTPPVPSPTVPPVVAPAVPVTPAPPVVVSPPPLPAAATVTDTVETETEAPRHSKRRAATSPRETSVRQAASQVPTHTIPAPADIKLTGIAWQDERSGRRAVINGLLLKEGTVISGARIADIKYDRVRFTTASGTFEIKLDAVMPPDPVKK